jgi:hypothetical protein
MRSLAGALLIALVCGSTRTAVADGEPPAPLAGDVLLAELRPEGQANRLGLRPGDVLVSYDGSPITDGVALRSAVQAAAKDRSDVAVRYGRDGETAEIRVASGLRGVSIATQPPDVAGPRPLGGGQVASALRSAVERGKRLEPLPGTRVAVETVAGVLRERLGDGARVTTLLGRDASASALFDAARGARILHLATHGIVDETETASFGALALSMPAVPVVGDDGFLTMIDLFRRWQGRLEGTELVVLSACDSARGKAQRHEGAYAFPWGFLFAGALRAARLATKEKVPHPYHGGAFVFAGAPR